MSAGFGRKELFEDVFNDANLGFRMKTGVS